HHHIAVSLSNLHQLNVSLMQVSHGGDKANGAPLSTLSCQSLTNRRYVVKNLHLGGIPAAWGINKLNGKAEKVGRKSYTRAWRVYTFWAIQGCERQTPYSSGRSN